jgi:DNA polymerase-3 subunit delta
MPPRFYLLHGPDELGSAEFVGALKEKMGDPAMASLDTSTFDGRAVTLSDLRGACDALPFLSPRRLVIVEGWLTKLLAKGEDEAGEAGPAAATSNSKEVISALADYLPNLPETTALVFVEKREIPERNPLLKAAANGEWGYVKFFDVPKGEALVRWTQARAKQAGGEFTREAAQALAAADPDPRALGNEIVKLLTYVDFARPVDVADVETLTPAGGEAKIFDLVDAIGQRRGPPAMRELHKLLEKEEPLYVLGMIVRQFRYILLAKEMLEARAGEADISRTLGLHPFPTEKICAQARNFPLPALEHIYHRLLDYDAEIKTGQVEAAVALDTLVASLTAA